MNSKKYIITIIALIVVGFCEGQTIIDSKLIPAKIKAELDSLYYGATILRFDSCTHNDTIQYVNLQCNCTDSSIAILVKFDCNGNFLSQVTTYITTNNLPDNIKDSINTVPFKDYVILKNIMVKKVNRKDEIEYDISMRQFINNRNTDNYCDLRFKGSGELISKKEWMWVPNPNPEENTTVYSWADQKPKFSGDLNKYLSDSIRYPEQARKDKIEGIVYLSAILQKDGSVSTVKVLRSPDEHLSKEAIRVVSKMPKWEPARINGVPVRFQQVIPVKFSF